MPGLLPSVPLVVTSESHAAPDACSTRSISLRLRRDPECSPRARPGLQSRALVQHSPRPSATSASQALQLPAAHPAQSRSHRISKLQAGSSLTSPGSYLHPNSAGLFAYQSLRSPPNLLEEVPLLSQILHKLLQFPQLLRSPTGTESCQEAYPVSNLPGATRAQRQLFQERTVCSPQLGSVRETRAPAFLPEGSQKS